MHPPRDRGFWSKLEALIVRAFKRLVPGARQSLRVTVKVQDGKPVSLLVRASFEWRPGAFDGAAEKDVSEVLAFLSEKSAVPVQYGRLTFKLRRWKLVASSVTETERREKD